MLLNVTVLLCFCYNSIETIEEKYDNSESMSTPYIKNNKAVGREVEEYELVSYWNDEGLF